MNRIILYPYKMGSASIKLLQEELRSRGHKVMRVRKGGKYRPRLSDLIVNWGCCSGNGMLPSWEAIISDDESGYINNIGINQLESVGAARNKLFTFVQLKQSGVSIPEYTSILSEVQTWIRNGDCVMGRRSLTGSKGADIEIKGPDFPEDEQIEWGYQVPLLFTKYIKKKAEYRVHVFGGEAIDVQQKKKKSDWTGERDTRIRNLANGYVFCREDITVPDNVLSEGIKAVKALGLDFGAADVIWNDKQKKAYVLEVNTAPGLEGKTVTLYADAIEKEIVKRGTAL